MKTFIVIALSVAFGKVIAVLLAIAGFSNEISALLAFAVSTGAILIMAGVTFAVFCIDTFHRL